MISKLNNYNEAHLKDLFEYYSETLTGAEEALPGRKDKSVSYHFIMDSASTLALVSYASGKDLATVAAFFEKALQACVQLFKQPVNRYTTPVALYEGIRLGLILNRPSETQQLAYAFASTAALYDKKSFFVDDVIMRYILFLGNYIMGNKEEALKAARENISVNKGRKETFVKEFILYTNALTAIQESNQPFFENTLQEIIGIHTLKATNGIFAEDPRGLLCLDGLALAAIALQKGLRATVESPYLPLQLLQINSPIHTN